MESLFDYIPFAQFTAPAGRREFARLGSGSFGSVLGGELFGTAVALKEVRPTSEYDVDKYFERELEMLRHLPHPNIVQYMGLTRSPPPAAHIYIVTERITGGTLSGRVVDSKAFPWRSRLVLVTDVARALAYIHAHRCLHRDVKGDNVLVTTNERAKLCDFGFARMAASSASEMARISFLGTSAYMAPELLLGDDYGQPADTFSFGVILCEVACRTMATEFPRSKRAKGIDPAHVRGQAEADCPPSLLALALECTCPRPRDRPDMTHVAIRLGQLEEQLTAQEKANMPPNPDSDQGPHFFSIGSMSPSTMKALMKHRQVKHGRKNRAMPAFDPPAAPLLTEHTEEDDEAEIGIGRYREGSQTTADEEAWSSETGSELGDADMDADEASNEALIRTIKNYIHADLPSNLLNESEDVLTGPSGVAEPPPEGGLLLSEMLMSGKTYKSAGVGSPMADVGGGWFPPEQDTRTHTVLADVSEHASQECSSSQPGVSSDIATVGHAPSDPDTPLGTGRDYSIAPIRSSTAHRRPAASHPSLANLFDRSSDGGTADDAQQGQTPPPPPPPHPTQQDEADDMPTPTEESMPGSFPAPPHANPSAAEQHGEPEDERDEGERTPTASVANRSEAGECLAERPHRFTLVNNGAGKRRAAATEAADIELATAAAARGQSADPRVFGTMLPPALLLGNALSHCSVCGRMVGWKRPFLDCDDCAYRVHVGCGHLAPFNCVSATTLSLDAAPSSATGPTHALSCPTSAAVGSMGQEEDVPARLRPVGLGALTAAAARPVPALDAPVAPEVARPESAHKKNPFHFLKRWAH